VFKSLSGYISFTTNTKEDYPRASEVAGEEPGVLQDTVLTGRRGCITSTPKTTDFRDFWPKTRKYERDSCMPLAKNGERPYPEPPKRPFWGPGFLGFRPLLRLISVLLAPSPLSLLVLQPGSVE